MRANCQQERMQALPPRGKKRYGQLRVNVQLMNASRFWIGTKSVTRPEKQDHFHANLPQNGSFSFGVRLYVPGRADTILAMIMLIPMITAAITMATAMLCLL